MTNLRRFRIKHIHGFFSSFTVRRTIINVSPYLAQESLDSTEKLRHGSLLSANNDYCRLRFGNLFNRRGSIYLLPITYTLSRTNIIIRQNKYIRNVFLVREYLKLFRRIQCEKIEREKFILHKFSITSCCARK